MVRAQGSPGWHRWGLALLFGATAGLHWGGAERAQQFPLFAALHLGASAGWLLVLWTVFAGRWRPRWRTALGLCLALRLLALPVAPSLSDDYFRYLHEGHLVAEGINPYLVAPDQCPEGLRGAYHDRINHPEIPAAYPPAVQWTLGAAALAQPTAQAQQEPLPWAIKGLFAACDLLVFVVLWRWLPAVGVARERALVHGLCPLMVLEFAVEGHSDSLAVLAVITALYAWSRGGWLRSGLALGVATAGKYLPVVLLPFLCRGASARTVAVGWAVALAVLYAPFLWSAWATEGLSALLQGTGEYVGRWRSNDSAFALIIGAAEWLLGAQGGVVQAPWAVALGLGGIELQRLIKLPLVLLGLGLLGWMWRRRWPPHRMAAGFFLFFILCSPTVHPWYVAFLVPFLAITPNPGALVFCATAYLSYHVLPTFLEARAAGVADLGSHWREVPGWKLAEYAPLYAGLAWGLVRGPRWGPPATPPPTLATTPAES